MKRFTVALLVCLGLLLGLAGPARAQRGYRRFNGPYYGPRYYHAPPYRSYGNRSYYRPRPYYGPRYYTPQPYYRPRYYRRPGPAVIIRP